MKDGLLHARAAILKLPYTATQGECIDVITELIHEFDKTTRVTFDKDHNIWIAVKGAFENFQNSVFGIGDSSSAAVADLEAKLLKELT